MTELDIEDAGTDTSVGDMDPGLRDKDTWEIEVDNELELRGSEVDESC